MLTRNSKFMSSNVHIKGLTFRGPFFSKKQKGTINHIICTQKYVSLPNILNESGIVLFHPCLTLSKANQRLLSFFFQIHFILLVSATVFGLVVLNGLKIKTYSQASYATLLRRIPSNIPRVSYIFLVHSRALRRMSIPRKRK